MAFLQRFSTHLRTKLLIALLLAAIVPVAGLAFFNIRSTNQTLTQNAEQSLVAAAGQTVTSFDSFMISNLDAVRTESQIPALVRALRNPSPATIDEASIVVRGLSRKDSLNIIAYGLISTEGRVIVDTVTTNIDSTQEAPASYVQQPLKDGLPYVSTIEFNGISEGMLTFSSPVRDNNGSILGVLRVRYRSAILQQLLVQNTERVGGQTFAMLIDANGLRLADSRNVGLINTLIMPLPPSTSTALQSQLLLPSEVRATEHRELAENLRSVEQKSIFVTTTHPDDAEPNQVAAVRLQQQPWHVVFAIPQQVFLEPIRAQVQTTILFVIGLVIFVGALAILFAQLLSAPLIRLTAIAEEVAKGNFQVHASVTSRDEIGTLAKAFNSMTAQLSQTMGDLEERVEARTQDLQTALTTQAAQSEQLHEALTLQQHLNDRVVALSMPIIPVQAGVLIVPLVGSPDVESLRSGQQRLLGEVVKFQARTVMIDVTGMTMVDPETAGVLVHMASTLRLLGARPILIGIRPEVAQTLIIQLGELEGIEAQSTLQSALRLLSRKKMATGKAF